ncbi:hypothetical protein GO986_17805 [Deinococcus sp. HMF7620]|uniref:Uncharacterized protein n=1 Tax=Deinococcus arboris TaxID=2682977 RepID=A0A7C9HTI7_9DEIO|nr:hypothetical protein [Deinococcus arboris]MVN88594.1 hypothetical protein [Deinococcus arboris]
MSLLPFRTGWGEVRPVMASKYGLTSLERLQRLHHLCQASEVAADPCTPERAARARRADRIADACRAEVAAQQGLTEPCGVCGQPGRLETGLCEACHESYVHTMAQDYAFWVLRVGA